MTAGAVVDMENEEVPSEDEEEEERQRRDCRGRQPRDVASGKDRLRVR